jgi:uncharacterized protein YchJ
MEHYADRCPCGQGLPYAQCCGPAHDGAPPATAEALMRSRYTAFDRLAAGPGGSATTVPADRQRSSASTSSNLVTPRVR